MNLHSYKHMGKLVLAARKNKKLTQTELAKALGMGTTKRNGQFISNTERALCGLPIKYWRIAGDVLGLSYQQLKAAHVHDISDSISLEYYK